MPHDHTQPPPNNAGKNAPYSFRYPTIEVQRGTDEAITLVDLPWLGAVPQGMYKATINQGKLTFTPMDLHGVTVEADQIARGKQADSRGVIVNLLNLIDAECLSPADKAFVDKVVEEYGVKRRYE